MTNHSLPSRDYAHVWHPFTPQLGSLPNIPIVRGAGALLFDAEGNSYIDAISSWWVNLHGHCNPYITERIKAQLDQLEHVLFSGYTHEPAINLAEKLKTLLPHMDKVFYSDDGSTSVEVALKMAFQYWHNSGEKRTKIIAFENAYHGDTFGSMSVGARNVFNNAFDPLLFDVVHIPVPVAGKERESIDALTAAIDKNTAAFIFEPLVQGAAGMIMYEPKALDKLLAICEQFDVITIADEVMTGFGRTGKMFAMDHCEHHADIVCLSKGITGGFMPLGVTMCTHEIYEAYLTDDRTKTFFHGHSYTANPLACAAAVANLEWFDKGVVNESIGEISAAMKQVCATFAMHPRVKDARCRGTILALELKSDEETGYLNAIGEKVALFFHERGVIMRPLGNVIYVIPPYCISEEELQQVFNCMGEFLEGL
ncbi:MAG TPA: adenosylmethionine--8-amino-7-oxononanoate transaminase [Bacteroidia bacterium]|nr:adenosylmethionine--8-amino-7-oxononanoate transaminase [Bacteroidia bacterium]